jgi:hypothetical protein
MGIESGVQSSLLQEAHGTCVVPVKNNVTVVCDGCGKVGSWLKMHPVDLDGESFNLCKSCKDKTKKFIERGCP